MLLAKSDLFFLKAFQCLLSQQQHQLAHGKRLWKCWAYTKVCRLLSVLTEITKLYLQNITNEISDNFMWLVHKLEQKQVECTQVLISDSNNPWRSEIYHLFMQSLRAKAYPPCAINTSKSRMVAMYHSGFGIGIAARDGKQSEALLMFHSRQLHHCTLEMLEYLKSSSYRRREHLELFD